MLEIKYLYTCFKNSQWVSFSCTLNLNQIIFKKLNPQVDFQVTTTQTAAVGCMLLRLCAHHLKCFVAFVIVIIVITANEPTVTQTTSLVVK